jgi:hypothetical protein
MNPETTGMVNCENKPLPFKNKFKHHARPTTIAEVKTALKKYADDTTIKSICLDSLSAYMDMLISECRATKKGFDIWSAYNEEIGKFLNYIKSIQKEVFITAHYEVLGIEATRQFMINEFMKIIGDINNCHIKLVVDKMTFTGTILSISRYSIRKDDIGPLSSATFEESMDKFTTAGIFTQIENTNGVSSSIMCGKNGKFGTGSFSIFIDPSKLPISNDIET